MQDQTVQTNFTLAQLADPAMAASEKILRTCVHCGFCTATCPTYLLLGDELDSPRGRIYLIKDMLEGGKPASPEVVRHVDRCLSCLSCMTTCPSGVHYMHLVDHARAHIEKTYPRPFGDKVLRAILALVLPYPARFRLALRAARLGQPLKGLVGRLPQVGNGGSPGGLAGQHFQDGQLEGHFHVSGLAGHGVWKKLINRQSRVRKASQRKLTMTACATAGPARPLTAMSKVKN